MKGDYFTDDLNQIKERYKNTRNNLSYVAVNELNHFYFLRVIFEIRLEPKFKELKQKMEMDENINEIQKSKNKKLQESLIKEFKDIRIKADADWEYSNNLLKRIEKEYLKNKNKKDAKEIYDKVSKGIIDSDIEKYIKYEKAIIIIVDNYKSLVLK